MSASNFEACSSRLRNSREWTHVSAKRVETIGETLGDIPLQVAAQYYLLYACHLSGDYFGAEQVGRRLMHLLQDERARERFGLLVFPAVQARECLARALAE